MIDLGITSTYSGKGVKAATADLGYLETGAARLRSTFNKTFAAFAVGTAAIAGLKSSVSAFASDQKQIEILNNSLKNMGFDSLSQSVDDFISQLALASGVAKSDLIPAYQNLLISTGSASKAQDALNIAMNVSAGTGKDLQTVTTAISKAYLGNTTSLTRLGAGLDKVLLKSGDMVAINQRLTDLFQGDASIAANSFSGQMAQLGQAAEAAKVSIGTNLVNALGGLSNDGSGIQTLIRYMNDLADAVNVVVTGLGYMAGLGKTIWGATNLFGGSKSSSAATPKGMGGINMAGTGGTGLGGASLYGPWTPAPTMGKVAGPQPMTAAQITALNTKAAADAKKKKAAADAYAQLVKKNALDKANYAILQLSNKFDMQRIELNAALASATDDQTRASIKGQIALLDAQDALRLGTTSGADAALKLATSSLTQLQTLDLLSKSTGDQANKVDTVSKAFTDLGLSTIALQNTFSSFVMPSLTNPDGSATSRANHNIPDYSTGGDTSGAASSDSVKAAADAAAAAVAAAAIAAAAKALDIQKSLDLLARKGYTSARAAGINGWQ